MPSIKLFTGRNCGWAVRNYAALIEKGIYFDTVSSLRSDNGKNNGSTSDNVVVNNAESQKCPEFLEASPYGKTPVLVHGDVTVFESTLINEYLDECFPTPPLMPPDPAGRIEVRKWIHYCETALLPSLTDVATAKTDADHKQARATYKTKLTWFVDKVLTNNWRGPYFAGEQFTLVDIAFHTLFRTTDEVEHLRPTDAAGDWAMDIASDPFDQWRDNIFSRSSIKQALEIQRQMPF